MTMKCPVCGAAELVHDTRDIPYTYKGETTTIPAVTGDFCPACDEVVLNREHGDRYSELVGLAQRQVKGQNRLTSVFNQVFLNGSICFIVAVQSTSILRERNAHFSRV
jgi:YgiT-type zinc finger domain-containing protein